MKYFKNYFYSLFIFFFLFPLYLNANDLCEVLLDSNTYIPETSIKDDYVLSSEITINKWKISGQSSISSAGFKIDLYYPNQTFENYLNKFYPNLKSDYCYISNKEQIKNIYDRVHVYFPQLRSNKDLKSIYNYFSVYKVNDNNSGESYWLFEYDLEKEIEIVNENYYQKFPFDEINTFINFEYPELSKDYVMDNFEKTFADFYGENSKKQIEWNKHNINKLSGLHEFNLKEHLIYGEPFMFLDGQEYANYVYFFSFKRNYNFYILKIIVPVIFLVFLSFSVFWIRNNEIEAKLNVSIVCLLALIAYNFAVNSDIPKLNSLTILDSFILISYLFSGLATFVTIYSYYDYRRDKLTGDFNPVDIKLRKIAPITYVASSLLIGTYLYMSTK